MLTIGGLVALVGQVPGGALVDAILSKRLVAGLATGAIGMSALALAIWPVVPIVQAAVVLQAAACTLGPAIAAISLGLVGHVAIGERLGRNARFASLGTAFAAVTMGMSGYLISNQAVFFVTAGFVHRPWLPSAKSGRARSIRKPPAVGSTTRPLSRVRIGGR